eukprot:CAMPEP_0174920002 /NCGR_PEP_ID=MMETSP1355-20121228/4047_1 /TAXON_ID=464990 /ORGANISM="Hemiselmis tepida, Strain CCMP443" /LENGTH=237 /DNA_ID=CAMNT_0016165293 /DNA_START=59 /DNA_END=768 /DNA_ORIENTATION=+
MTEVLNNRSLHAAGDPNRFKTAVVCDMLGRLCTVAGSMGGVIERIRTELMRAVYVDFRDGASPFAMKPYFVAAQASAAESKDAARERDSLLNQLGERDEKIVLQKKIIRDLREESQTAKLDAAWTRTKQNNLEVQLLQRPTTRHGASEEADEEAQQHQEAVRKLTFDLKAVEKLLEGAQQRVRELEHDVEMANIRASAAEKEWRDASYGMDSLKKEIAMLHMEMGKTYKSMQRAESG